MSVLRQAYDRLWERYGPQHWWPAEAPLEVIVGAVLTQNTSWVNVERALTRLREADVLSLERLNRLSRAELEELIQPAGSYRVKAHRLRNLLDAIAGFQDGDLSAFLAQPKDELRLALLAVNGIGPETADAIVLYAAGQPTFVVDAYTARVAKRHGWMDMDADYEAIQARFQDELPEDVALFNEYHALLVRVGKEYCRPSPRCEACPLADLLPATGPLQMYSDP